MKGFPALLKERLVPNRKGTYILVLNLPKDRTITIGRLGTFRFRKGTYFYVGSAKGGFSKRVIRYFRNKKAKRWHIDYLLEYAEPTGVFLFDEFFKEDGIARKMKKMYGASIKHFGSSDTSFETHLFYKEGK